MNAILGDLKEKVRDRLPEKNLYMWLVEVKYDLMAHNQLNVYFCQLLLAEYYYFDVLNIY